MRLVLSTWLALFVLHGCLSPSAPGSGDPDKEPEQLEDQLFPVVPESCVLPTAQPAELIVVVTPTVGDTMVAEHYEPIARYIESATKLPTKIIAASTYKEAVDLVVTGDVHIAFLPPLAYVTAKKLSPCTQLLLTQVTDGFTHYPAYLMVKSNSSYETFRDLEGGNLGLLPDESASGNLYPRYFFTSNNIDISTFFNGIYYYRDHITALEALAKGDVDVISTYPGVSLPAEGSGIRMSDFRVLVPLGRVPYDAVVATSRLDRGTAKNVGHALQALNTTNEKSSAILRSKLDMNGWVYTRDSIYEPIRDMLNRQDVTR